MSLHNTLDDVKKDYRGVWEFEAGAYTYKRCKDSCEALNRTLGSQFKAVYRQENVLKHTVNSWEAGCVNWDGETFYAVNPKGKVISFSNSEWGGVGFEK